MDHKIVVTLSGSSDLVVTVSRLSCNVVQLPILCCSFAHVDTTPEDCRRMCSSLTGTFLQTNALKFQLARNSSNKLPAEANGNSIEHKAREKATASMQGMPGNALQDLSRQQPASSSMHGVAGNALQDLSKQQPASSSMHGVAGNTLQDLSRQQPARPLLSQYKSPPQTATCTTPPTIDDPAIISVSPGRLLFMEDKQNVAGADKTLSSTHGYKQTESVTAGRLRPSSEEMDNAAHSDGMQQLSTTAHIVFIFSCVLCITIGLS